MEHDGSAGRSWFDRQYRGREIAQHRIVIGIAFGKHFNPRLAVPCDPVAGERDRQCLQGDALWVEHGVELIQVVP